MNFHSNWAFLCYTNMVFTYTIKQKLDLDLGTIELMNKSLFYAFFPHLLWPKVIWINNYISLVFLLTG